MQAVLPAVVTMLVLSGADGKVISGHLSTREQWAYLTRFCFLSGEGRFSYDIEYDADFAVQKLLLYYDSDDQWPAVYKSGKSCEEKLAVLDEPQRHQFINLSSQFSTFSGCEIRRHGKRATYHCSNNRTFFSARERWWFIGLSNCESELGLDLKYNFLMTNGPEEDLWTYQFSADEMYILRTNICMFCAQMAILFISTMLAGRVLEAASDFTFLLLLLLCAKGYTITRGRLRQASSVKLTIFLALYVVSWGILFVYEQMFFDPGEVLYLYESPGGYGLLVLKLLGWAMFVYSTSFTIKHYPEKWSFYLPFSAFYTVWFLSAPLVILCSNYLIDKWVREKVVNGVEHAITFAGHIFFLVLTRPTAANKNFPFHVRTSQISIMEQRPNGVAGNNNLDHFSSHCYAPSAPPVVVGGAPQTTPTNLFVINTPIEMISVPNGKPYVKQDNSFPHETNTSVPEAS